MKNLNAFTALNEKEVAVTFGGQLAPQLGDLNTLPIIRYGDPREWDPFFFTLENTNGVTYNL